MFLILIHNMVVYFILASTNYYFILMQCGTSICEKLILTSLRMKILKQWSSSLFLEF